MRPDAFLEHETHFERGEPRAEFRRLADDLILEPDLRADLLLDGLTLCDLPEPPVAPFAAAGKHNSTTASAKPAALTHCVAVFMC